MDIYRCILPTPVFLGVDSFIFMAQLHHHALGHPSVSLVLASSISVVDDELSISEFIGIWLPDVFQLQVLLLHQLRPIYFLLPLFHFDLLATLAGRHC